MRRQSAPARRSFFVIAMLIARPLRAGRRAQRINTRAMRGGVLPLTPPRRAAALRPALKGRVRNTLDCFVRIAALCAQHSLAMTSKKNGADAPFFIQPKYHMSVRHLRIPESL